MYYGLDFFQNRLEEKNIFGVILEAVNSLCTSIVMSEKTDLDWLASFYLELDNIKNDHIKAEKSNGKVVFHIFHQRNSFLQNLRLSLKELMFLICILL